MMKTLAIFFVMCSLAFSLGSASQENDATTSRITESDKAQAAEEQLAKQIFEIIEHFKQDDPVGLPVVPLEDPADVPDVDQSISMATLQMRNAKLSGISKFRIKYVTTEVKEMEAKCGIFFDSLLLTGDYTLRSFVSRSKGPFTINLKDVFIEGNATVGVERDGTLKTQEINIDIKFSGMQMDFKNLGFFAAVFQSIANSASNVIFDNLKPLLLKDAYVKIKAAIDENLLLLIGSSLIPNSITPVDNAIAEARRQFRAKGFDPMQVDDYNYPGVIGVKIYNTWLYGITSFYRLGEMSLKIENNSAIVTMEVGTQEISGSTNWQVQIAKGMITRAGSVQFSVQHVKALFTVTQPLNLSKKLKIDDLQLDLGNIQIRCNGLGTADYLVEFFVNVLPNLLRYQIMDALEKPLMRKAQEFSDKIDIEQTVKAKFEEYQKTGAVKWDLKVEL